MRSSISHLLCSVHALYLAVEYHQRIFLQSFTWECKWCTAVYSSRTSQMKNVAGKWNHSPTEFYVDFECSRSVFLPSIIRMITWREKKKREKQKQKTLCMHTRTHTHTHLLFTLYLLINQTHSLNQRDAYAVTPPKPYNRTTLKQWKIVETSVVHLFRWRNTCSK